MKILFKYISIIINSSLYVSVGIFFIKNIISGVTIKSVRVYALSLYFTLNSLQHLIDMYHSTKMINWGIFASLLACLFLFVCYLETGCLYRFLAVLELSI